MMTQLNPMTKHKIDSWMLQWIIPGAGRKHKPTGPTVYGQEIEDGYAKAHPAYPLETMLERATRLGIIDEWIPQLWVTIGKKRLHYEGAKALELYDQLNQKESSPKYWWERD